MNTILEDLLATWLEHRLTTGERLDPSSLCTDHPELIDALEESIRQLEQLEATLSDSQPTETGVALSSSELPQLAGFRVIERLGAGGTGEVFKAEDLELGRVVAIKVLRHDRALRATTGDFLREARALALFEDPRIVRLYEIRTELDPPILVMEHIDGFELGAIGPSLEFRQRAKIIAEVAEAVQGAHQCGIQHRDLKPGNILIDRLLQPRLLDFGLSSGAPDEGHNRGTPAYMAPEQLSPGVALDDRIDVYALGVVLYELLCGALPFSADNTDDLVKAILEGSPRLPGDIDRSVPEPLQAIALKAMERDPAARYDSAASLAQDLHRFLGNRPVLARPSQYRRALVHRTRPHQEAIKEWCELKLIYPHEAERLGAAYRRLHASDDDWVIHSRALSWSRISLYLGAFLLLCGSLFFFSSYFLEAVTGVLRPALTLGLPVVGLNLIGFTLFRRERRAVAVAFFLAASALLPWILLILLREAGWLALPAESSEQLLSDAWLSNHQLQVAFLLATSWALWLAIRTRTTALASACITLATCAHLAIAADFGLRRWLEEGRWDLLAGFMIPLMAAELIAGWRSEVIQRPRFAVPLYFAGAGLLVVILELAALDGRFFAHLGLSLEAFQPAEVSSPTLLATVVTMVINGVLIYGAGWLMENRGSPLQHGPAVMLFTVAPFAILEPAFYLNVSADYSIRYCWIYLGLALAITLLSHVRQRRSFYIAGLTNTGLALWQITSRHEWFDEPLWATVIILVGLFVLAVGSVLDGRERSLVSEAPRSPDG